MENSKTLIFPFKTYKLFQVKIVKALQKNSILHELRIDNQRHIFGQNVEQEFVKYLRHNETLCRFGYQFGNAGHRMTCNNFLTR